MRQSVIKSIGSMMVLTIVSKLLRMCILMITVRFLSPDDFGIIAAFTMVLAFVYLFAEMGVVKTLIQRPHINDQHIGASLLISSVCSFLSIAFLLFLSEKVEQTVGISGITFPLQIASCLFVFLAFSNICSALLQRSGDIVYIAQIQAGAVIASNILITVPLLLLDASFWAVIVGTVIAELISLLLIIRKGFNRLRFSVAKKELRELCTYSLAFMFHNVVGLVSKQIDIFLVGRYLGGSNLGNYSRSLQLIDLPNQLYWLVVDRVVFPSMSSMQGNKRELADFFIRFYSILLLGLCIGAIFLHLGAEQIINILMGSGWGAIVILTQILSVNIVSRSLIGFLGSFIAAYGHVKLLTYKNIITLLTFSVAIYWGLDYGIQGVAYASVCASLFNLMIMLSMVIYLTKVTAKSLLIATLPTINSCILIIGIFYILSSWLLLSELFIILLSLIIYTFSAVLLCSHYLTPKLLIVHINIFKKRWKVYFAIK